MRENVNDREFLQSRQANRASQVIRENEERSAEYSKTAMQSHSVHDRSLSKLANAVCDVSSGRMLVIKQTACVNCGFV